MTRPLDGILVPAELDMHDPQAIDEYGRDARPEGGYPLMVLGYAPVDTVGERTRRCVEDELHAAHVMPADWSVALFKERQEGGEIREGRGFLDTEFEMSVMDGSGTRYADLLVYGLEVEHGRVSAAWFVVG